MRRPEIRPILEAVPAARQEAARHYGVHPYFTRRPSNVVRAYIERYSFGSDTVLDPFGGTGVTAVEAFLLGRQAIHNDLNPFANFIAGNIADTSLRSVQPLREAFDRVKGKCEKSLREIESSEVQAGKWLASLPLPENILLPRTSDAERFFDMFTTRQLAGLALIKQAIESEHEEALRNALLLAWSASVGKLNKTFLSAKGRAASRGGSSIFSIYRYKLASQPVELPIWETFQGRYENVIAAKEEILQFKRYRQQVSPDATPLDSTKNFRVLGLDAAELEEKLGAESVDYIFTDPPYGGFISYLDLSILWNHWLGFAVSQNAAKCEAIVGGEQGHSEEHYKSRLTASITTCVKLLRPDRWLSVVFQHWDVSYFEAILESATDAGAELRAAITQTGDVIWSMHKKKNSAHVLAGEMILTFYKPARKLSSAPQLPLVTPEAALHEAFDKCLTEDVVSFSSESLFNRLIMELWNRRALDCLKIDRKRFISELEGRGWNYNSKTHVWSRGSSIPLGDDAALLFDR